MKDFKGKVAVVTGASSGIGRALAERCAKEGMKVVLAGINAENLNKAEQVLSAKGATVLSVPTDVSKLADIEALAQKTLNTYGAVHILFNNAGVGAGSTIWENSLADWQWVMGVNLWGVIYGLRVFVPIMLAQDTECHIVNTASIVGLMPPFHPFAPYQVSKHAVVALSEHLCYSLIERKAKVKASVLCPGWVNTRALDCERDRPLELQNTPMNESMSPESEAIIQGMRQSAQAGMSPKKVAGYVFKAIRAEQFYILTHPELNSEVQKRMEDILQQRNPA